MLEKFSRNAAVWLINIGLLVETDIDLYSYAIKNLFLIINPTIIFTIYCIASHKILLGLLEMFSFLLIRKYSGGYHCQSSTSCLILSTIMLIFDYYYYSIIMRFGIKYKRTCNIKESLCII